MKIKEQIRESIVELAPEEPTGEEFYLPHKPVLKESAESTKLRIVYDASARPDGTSPSLNEYLETGPPLQTRIWNILTRNHMRPITLTEDIKQAFLQIRIRQEHGDSLRFHWITDRTTQEIQVLRFTRAVLWLVQSPFLFGGTLEHHLNQFTREYPEIVEEIKTNVDDIIFGGETT